MRYRVEKVDGFNQPKYGLEVDEFWIDCGVGPVGKDRADHIAAALNQEGVELLEELENQDEAAKRLAEALRENCGNGCQDGLPLSKSPNTEDWFHHGGGTNYSKCELSDSQRKALALWEKAHD